MRENLLRQVLTFILKLLFNVRVKGIEHFRAAGERTLIICNHQSFLDPLLLAILIPEKPAFAMNLYQADKWYFRWVSKVVKIYRLDPSQPMSMKTLLADMKKGGKVVYFPEGRITTTGGIMKIYDGAALLASKTGASILPIHVDGAQYSKLSKLSGKLKQRWFPDVSLTFFPPITTDHVKEFTSDAIYEMMTSHMFEAQDKNRPLLAAILQARSMHGKNKVIGTDVTRATMTYQSLFTRGFVLSEKLRNYLATQSHVGVLLPNSLAVMATFVSLHMLGKTPCMLNFSAGAANILSACATARLRTVLTSRAFIEKGRLESVLEALQKEYVIIFLEDVRADISGMDKIKGAVKALAPSLFLMNILKSVKAYDPAVVLYTSGSEGVPKGVVLSHTNILANIYQSFSRFDINPADKLFNPLPVFHSFGLTIGMLMPMVGGLSTFLYPSPLHYRVIPELIYDTDATIMVGTDTFYQGYAHYAHPYDFRSVRLAVAGAEKLKETTRQMFADRFGIPIMQGYGVTETSPVISCNTGLYHKAGTVGRIFPGMQWQLEPVEGIHQGGRLWIRGPNVMTGYMKADNPGIVQPQGEWYDTGDIVDVDPDGYISILGRAKRFAKIAGEMVSLAAVEEFMSTVDSTVKHACIAIPDDRKGEQVLLITEAKNLNRPTISNVAREVGFPEIFLPRHIMVVDAIPLLGSGKIDYPKVQELAKSYTPA